MATMPGTTIEEYESDTTIEEDQTTAAKLRQNLVVIPVIPRPLAIFCLVANIILPGSGNAHDFLCIIMIRIYHDPCRRIFSGGKI